MTSTVVDLPNALTATSLFDSAEARGLLEFDEAHVIDEIVRYLQWLVAWDGSFDSPTPDIDERLQVALENVGCLLVRGIDPLDWDAAFASFRRESAPHRKAHTWAFESVTDVAWVWPYVARVAVGHSDYIDALADDDRVDLAWLRARLLDGATAPIM